MRRCGRLRYSVVLGYSGYVYRQRPSTAVQHGELIALVSRQQDQVARLTATIKELRKELAEAKRAGKRQAAPFSKAWANQQAQTLPAESRAWGTSATASRRLQMRSPSRQWMCRWPTDKLSRMWRSARAGGSGCCLRDRHPRDAQTAGDRVPGAGVSVSWLRQTGTRSATPMVGADQYGASAHQGMGRRVMAAAHVSCTMEWAYRCGGFTVVLRALTGVELSQGRDHPGRTAFRAEGAVGDAYR